jgi:hypothetical protein
MQQALIGQMSMGGNQDSMPRPVRPSGDVRDLRFTQSGPFFRAAVSARNVEVLNELQKDGLVQYTQFADELTLRVYVMNPRNLNEVRA